MTFTKILETDCDLIKFRSQNGKFQINIGYANEENKNAQFFVSLFAGPSLDWVGSYDWDKYNMLCPMNTIPEEYFEMVKEVAATEGFNLQQDVYYF